jgi:hypothetical protein
MKTIFQEEIIINVKEHIKKEINMLTSQKTIKSIRIMIKEENIHKKIIKINENIQEIRNS